MTGLRRAILQCALLLIVLLTVLSIYGAFRGAEAAQVFFNSIPVGVYWAFFAVLLGVSIGVFPRLLKVPSLLFIHAGCICILFGGLYGSRSVIQWSDQIRSAEPSIRSGRMILYEGETDNRVMLSSEEVSFGKDPSGRIGVFEADKEEPVMLEDADPRLGKLPFALRLTDFRIEYYSGDVVIQGQGQQVWRVLAEAGTEYHLGDHGTVTILETYQNLKLRMDNGQMVPYDQPGSDENPAVRLLFRYPDGTEEKRYVFANSPGHSQSDGRWGLQYQRMIKDYFSDLEVVENGQVVERKTIEVNYPLYYGGYFFYQDSYDSAEMRYTVLRVTSARGLVAVFLGFALVVAGSFWHFWIPRRRGL
jgi:hypothetical protein